MQFLGLHHTIQNDNLMDRNHIVVKHQAVFKLKDNVSKWKSISSMDLLIYMKHPSHSCIHFYKSISMVKDYQMKKHIIVHSLNHTKFDMHTDYYFELNIKFFNHTECVLNKTSFGHKIQLLLNKNNGCMFMSCNGKESDKTPKHEHQWSNYKKQTKALNHVFLFGLGDQVYLDDKHEKHDIFMTYIESFYGKNSFNERLNQSICVMCWDDHEYDNSWEYDDFLNENRKCNKSYTLPQKFKWCYEYYHLFQKFQIKNIEKDINPFGRLGNHRYLFIQNTLFVHLDTRSEKSEKHMLRKSTYQSLFLTLEKYKHQFDNVCLLIASPIGIPNIGKEFQWIQNADNFIKNLLGRKKHIFSFFKDINDMWWNKRYEKETNDFLNKLSKTLRNKKIHIVAGDVHCGIDCTQKINGNYIRHLTTSSASNNPIPSVYANYLNSKIKYSNNSNLQFMYRSTEKNNRFICVKNNILTWDKNKNRFKFIICE